MKRSKRRTGGEAHVRLYRHELDCPAFRTLSANARVLLIELRALFDPKRGDNRVFMGIRDMRQRCNLTQLAATRARDELLERGWISMVERGTFHRKVKHATVYALEHEAPSDRKGSVPSKAFMRWQPPTRKNPVLESGTPRYSNQVPSHEKEAATVLESNTDKPSFHGSPVLESSTQIAVTKRSESKADAFFRAASVLGLTDRAQLILIAGGLAERANELITRKAA